MLGNYLEQMSWIEAEKILEQAAVVIIPIGARCKEHGCHLPLNTDWILAEYLTERVLSTFPAVALPTVTYGYYPAFLEYAGSVSVACPVFEALLSDICRSIARHSRARFYFLNTGISTNWALEPARLALQGEQIIMEFSNLTVLLQAVEQQVCAQPRGSHADEVETSMMLYIRPDLVQLEQAKPELNARKGSGRLTRLPSSEGIYSPTGAWGDPTLASRDKGKDLVETLVTRIVNDLKALTQETFVPAPARTEYLSGSVVN